MPEQGTRPVNKYLPPRDRDIDILAPLLDPLPEARAASSAGSTGPSPASDASRPVDHRLHHPLGPRLRPDGLARHRRRPDAGLAAFLLPPSPLGLAAAGLLASLLHLGQPPRFLKAFSQWRTSWLSREAVLAVATLAAFTLFAALWVLSGLRTRWLGLPAAALALATVAATAMIYAQMRSVPRWRSPLTPALFLLFALAGGALLAGAARRPLAPRRPRPRPARRLARRRPPPRRLRHHARHRHRPRRPRPAAPARAAAHRPQLPAARDGATSSAAATPRRLRAARPRSSPCCCRSRLLSPAAARHRPPLAAGRRRPCRGRAGPALAVLRGGRARGWTLLRKALSTRSAARWRSAPHGQARKPKRSTAARTGAGQPPRLQVAALCWRRSGKGLRILLITSRDTGRWVIPKGWPMRNRTDAEAAAREAYEEAGLRGIVAERSIGLYTYRKAARRRGRARALRGAGLPARGPRDAAPVSPRPASAASVVLPPRPPAASPSPTSPP